MAILRALCSSLWGQFAWPTQLFRSLELASFCFCLLLAALPLRAHAAQASVPNDEPSQAIEAEQEPDKAEQEVNKDPLANASEIYSKALSEPKSGLYFAGELAFVVVVIEKASELDSEQLEKECLLNTLKILRQAGSDAKNQDALPPLSNELLDTFGFLKAECRKADPFFATRRLNLDKVESRVIENQLRESSYRNCVALRAGDLQRAWSDVAPPTISETLVVLRKRLESLEDEPEALAEFWGRFGAVDEVLNLANEESWLEWPMNSYGEPLGDSLDLIRMVRNVENKSKAGSAAELRRVLQALPGLPEGFGELAKKAEDSEQYAKALNFLILSRIEGDEFIKPESLIAKWRAKCGDSSPHLSEGLAEFVELFQRLKSHGTDFNQIGHPAIPILNRTWNTQGSANLPKKLVRVKPASAGGSKSKVRDGWPDVKVLDEFYAAVCENPRSPAVWRELGAKAKESSELELAIVCLRQAVRLGTGDFSSRMLLAQSYQEIGFQRLFLSTALAAAVEGCRSDDEQEAGLRLLTSALQIASERRQAK